MSYITNIAMTVATVALATALIFRIAPMRKLVIGDANNAIFPA